jgi:hypothetical protein
VATHISIRTHFLNLAIRDFISAVQNERQPRNQATVRSTIGMNGTNGTNGVGGCERPSTASESMMREARDGLGVVVGKE